MKKGVKNQVAQKSWKKSAVNGHFRCGLYCIFKTTYLFFTFKNVYKIYTLYYYNPKYADLHIYIYIYIAL